MYRKLGMRNVYPNTIFKHKVGRAEGGKTFEPEKPPFCLSYPSSMYRDLTEEQQQQKIYLVLKN